MQSLTLGYMNNTNQIHVFEFSKDEKNAQKKTMDVIDLPDQNLNCLLFDGNEIVEQFGSEFEKYIHLFPIVNAQEVGLTDLDSADSNEVFNSIESLTEKWVIQNNLLTLEEIFPLKDHLKTLYVNDRNTFFEEFWYFLKRNLGTSELTLIFNDVIEPEDESKGDRPKLIHSTLTGQKTPNFTEGTEKESKIMEHFKDSFTAPFDINDFDEEKGQGTFLCNINGSPILIMAKCHQLNSMQDSLLTGLLTGLQG